MSALREFTTVSMRYGDRQVAGVSITCKCGQTAQHTKGQNKGYIDDGQLAKRFRRMFEYQGWRVGKSAAEDRCPECLKAATTKPQLSIVSQPKENVMLSPTQAPPTAQPREPSRDDNRIIHQHLDEKYDTRAQRYSKDWTDAKVAVDLGVPRAWVENVRKMFFGPEGSNQEIQAGVNEAQALLASCTTLLANIEKVITDARATLSSLDGERIKMKDTVDRVARKIEVIEKAVRP